MSVYFDLSVPLFLQNNDRKRWILTLFPFFLEILKNLRKPLLLIRKTKSGFPIFLQEPIYI